MEEDNDNCLYSAKEEEDVDIDNVGLNIDLDENSNSNSQTQEVDEPTVSGYHERPIKRHKCNICLKRFKQKVGIIGHMKRMHNVVQSEDKLNVRCLERDCTFACSYKEKLQQHLSAVHGMDMAVTIKQFDSLQDFVRWKDDFETQERSRFVKKSGSRLREEGVRVAYYYCNRSGSYVTTGKKNKKKRESAKSNNHCTASITCVEHASGKVEVKVCSTHYGHEYELQHLRLTQSEKFQIAEQLVRGVPRELILDTVRSTAGSKIDRIHLITMKDVKNIERAYGIQSSSSEKMDDMSSNLDSWIEQILKTEHSPVLYYKSEGVVNTKNYSLCFVLLTSGQIDIIDKFGTDGIYYVNTFVTRSTNTYSTCARPPRVYVTTLVLVDDINEACPVSYMITNDIQIDKFKIFFDCLKKRLPNMSAKVVLTDEKLFVFNKWCEAFQEQPYHVWSNRFVDGDWRENLISVVDEDIQGSIYETLYSYLESKDREKLEASLTKYVAKLKENVVTQKFGDYFAHKYLGSEYLWAGCYAKRIVGITPQVNMELLYNETEEMCLKKHWDKNFLVKLAQQLLKFVNDKQCLRHTKIQRHIQEIPNHHKLALDIKDEALIEISDTEWRVNSEKDPQNIFAIVIKEQKINHSLPCSLHCFKCNNCAHEFSCSCQVYSYDRTMCKHIHAVLMRSIKPVKPKQELPVVDECMVDSDLSDNQSEDSELPETRPRRLVTKFTWPSKGKKRKKPQITKSTDLLPVIQDLLRNRPRGKRKKTK